MPKTTTKYASLALLCLLLLVTVFTTGAILKTPKWSSSTAAAVGDQQSDPAQNIQLTIYDVGIYPEELEVAAGRLSIVFNDRTRKYSGFIVERISGSRDRVGQIEAAQDHWRTRAEVRVTPGRYRVFTSDRPEIQAILIVNP